MKKLLCILLFLIVFINAPSCGRSKNQSPENKQSEDEQGAEQSEDKNQEKLDKKEGKKVLEEYMKALVLRDIDKAKGLYSEGLKQQAGSFAAIQNPHPNGYKVDNLEEKDGKLEGSAVLLSVSTGKPYFSLDENKYTIIKEKNKYVIDKIEKSKNTEVMEKNRTLFKKEGGDIKGKEIIKLDDLPAFAVPQGATPDQKFSVGRDAFGPVAGDAEGKMLAISTKGNHPAIIVYDGKQKKAKSIDLFFNNTIDSLSWSEKGKYLSAEVTNPGGTKSVFIYDPENEKKIDDPMKNAMKPGKYTIINSYWISDDELVFTVQLKSTLPANEQNMAGTYKFDVKNLSITRS